MKVKINIFSALWSRAVVYDSQREDRFKIFQRNNSLNVQSFCLEKVFQKKSLKVITGAYKFF